MECLYAWASNAANFRKLQPSAKGTPIRFAISGIEIPKGFKVVGCGLAFEGVKRIPTMRDFVKALT